MGVDLAPVLAFARALLAEQPLTGGQLRAALAERFPSVHAPAAAYACRCLVPLVQVPPRGVWGRAGAVRSTPLESWVGRPLAASPSIDDVVLRYLAAFGPATPADVSTWSGLKEVREVVERLRPVLRVFRDDRDRELFDLPDAPRPPPDTPSPVRFLPEYDDLLLSHADRCRFGVGGRRRPFAAAVGPAKGSVLVDGVVGAIWHAAHDAGAERTTIVVEHLRLSRAAVAAVEAEAHRTARFRHGASAHDVQLRQVDEAAAPGRL